MKKILLLALLFVSLASSPLLTNAQLPQGCIGTDCPQGSGNQGSNGAIVLPKPIDVDDPRILVGNIIKIALGLVGSLALVMFIYGGLMMMVSSGNSDLISKGRNTLIWAVLGLVVIFSSYTIINFVLTRITTPTP